MRNHIKIPEDFTEFLYWIKETTEKFWNVNPKESTSDYVCDHWAYGAKWIGMNENDIKLIETKYNIEFNKYHKEFLKILHTIDRKEIVYYPDENGKTKEISFFYNWNTDNLELKCDIDWAYLSIKNDVLNNNIWLTSWGEKPNSIVKKEETFNKWFSSSPNLIPVSVGQYILSQSYKVDSPILSICGADTIVTGANFRHYLLYKLRKELGLVEWINEGNENWHLYPSQQMLDINEKEYELLRKKDIPLWKEFLIENGANSYWV